MVLHKINLRAEAQLPNPLTNHVIVTVERLIATSALYGHLKVDIGIVSRQIQREAGLRLHGAPPP